ncbi:MAG: DUF4438 domain-containing protein [Chloroflexi bacterium]|nr:DUF4438 domain-containing protein [Chloroflexota bacterium]
MLKTNVERLVKISVMGTISHPRQAVDPYKISVEGKPVVLPGTGGITYNVKVGDLIAKWRADHIEPGVSMKNTDDPDPGTRTSANDALIAYSCIGNKAVVVSGHAQGGEGVVTGKHGGVDHVIAYFKEEILYKLIPGDKILIQAFGLGLEIEGLPNVKVMNIDPGLLQKMDLRISDGILEVPVSHHVPARIMGSGLGRNNSYKGDYDIQLFDEKTANQYRLKDLRFGDIVAVIDADNTYGRSYREGAVSVGVVVHGACYTAGHGPGFATLFTSREGKIRPRISSGANLADILDLK